MPNAIMIALSAPTSADDEAEYNKWNDEVHVPEVAAFKGVVSARRYKVANIQTLPGISGPSHPYLTIYELAAATETELQGFMDVMSAALQGGHFTTSESIDAANTGAILALPISR